MDLNWKKLPVTHARPEAKKRFKKPEKLDEMIDLCRKLSKNFPMVRTDLYFVKNRIYFGELTFTPDNGLKKYDPKQFDYEMGERLNLLDYNKNRTKKIPKFFDKLLFDLLYVSGFIFVFLIKLLHLIKRGFNKN